MPTNLGAAEILVILVVALIVLGPKKLPEAGRQVGKAMAEVRRWSRGIQTEIRDAFDTAEEPPMVSTEQLPADTAARSDTATKTEAATETVDVEATTPVLPEQAPEGPELPPPTNGSGPPDEPSRQ